MKSLSVRALGTLIGVLREDSRLWIWWYWGETQAKIADLCQKHIGASRSYRNGERKPTICKYKEVRKTTLGAPKFMGWRER